MMELKPLEINFTQGEKIEVLKRTINEKTKELQELERRIRELMREDEEKKFLSDFIGAEYINPTNANNQAEIEPLMQQRQIVGYVLTMAENKLAEVTGQPVPNAPAPQAQAAPRQQGSGNAGNMWG